MLSPKLKEFLKTREERGEKSTHGSMGGGAWAINTDDIPEFHKLYAASIKVNGPLYMTEKSTKIGSCRVDLDFLYDGIHPTHLHTQSQVVSFLTDYLKELATLVVLPPRTICIVSEKPEPTVNEKRTTSKSGIHILLPDVKTNRFVEEEVRKKLLSVIPTHFVGLPLKEDWRKIYDAAMLTHTNNWTMLGSKKQDGTPYEIKYSVILEKGVVRVEPADPIVITSEWVDRMSVRAPKTAEIEMTDHGKAIVERSGREIAESRVSGGNAVIPTRGRPLTRTEHANSRASTPDPYEHIPLDPFMLEYYTAHAMNLSTQRSVDRDTWIEVGHCLRNIHLSLEDAWHSFSAKDPAKYDERDASRRWNGFQFRTDGTRLGIGSLRYWSRLDNPDRYIEIEKMNIENVIATAILTGTEHDVAEIVFSMYRDHYKCVAFRNNTWYRFGGHYWIETDSGCDLLFKLSKEVWRTVYGQKIKIENNIQDVECVCPSDKKQDRIQDCPSCILEDTVTKFSLLLNKLKQTKFKDNVMKECRELFYDKDFISKLDETPHLLACNNGVLDLSTMTFRNGDTEDYISFSTQINFEPDRPHTDHKVWPELKSFLENTLPEEWLYTYMTRHFSSCLRGGNEAQKFYVLTGTGSNGKSMLINLLFAAFGDYACNIPITMITQARPKTGAAEPDKIRMKGRRVVTMQEPDEGVILNSGYMKELISGEKITARDLFKGSKEILAFFQNAKIHAVCNDLPKVNATDDGAWRRIAVAHFPTKFVDHVPVLPHERAKDMTIEFKVKSPEWAECFLSYLFSVYKEGSGWRKLLPPTQVMAYTRKYREESDLVARYIADRLVPCDDTGVYVSKMALGRNFAEWKRGCGDVASTLAIATVVTRIETHFNAKYVKPGWTCFRFEEND